MSGGGNIRQAYNESFLEVLDQLNDHQRQAVDQIEGPVLVIAGPGTGKTHILTARIGRILLETDAQAQNILCLTFTDAGVQAMRERLLEFIGPEAHRVHIYTFHSFCNTIIQDNLELFGRHDLEPLSELERVEIIRRMIDQLDVDHPLKRGRADAYFYENHLYDLFKRMKGEDWTADYVLQRIETYLQGLPQREDFIYKVNRGKTRKGDLKTAKLEAEQRRMGLLRSAVQLYEVYQNALQRARRYDFDDMILWVLRAFETHEVLLRNYQEQYLYFLVDEYQDTNGAQNEIIQQLIAYWDNPNIFIVGDDDQSIYEFQGARLKNLIDFYDQHREELRLVLLQDNYRSTQPILDLSGMLIRHNEKRIVNNLRELGVEKNLRASNLQIARLKGAPNITSYPNRLQENMALALEIEALREAGVALHEIAVIYAKHRQADDLIRLLEKRDIAYNTRRRVNILDLNIMRNLRLLLLYLQLEFERPHSGEHLLFKILHINFIGMAPADLTRASVFLAKKEGRNRPPWREVLRDEGLLQKMGVDPEPFLRLGALIDELIGEVINLGVPALLERLINRSGLLRYTLDHAEKVWLLQVMKSFFDFVRAESDRNPRLSLRRLLDILRSMDDNRLAIALTKTIQAEEGVNLLTAHSAKGLEFTHVFLLDCVKDNWEPRSRGSAFRFSMPDTLTFSGEEDAMEARRRLFYVAMTRAKEGLRLSYARKDQNKPLQRACFIDELCLTGNLQVQEKELPTELLLEANFLQLLLVERPQLPNLDKVVIDSLLEHFSLSVSGLNRYLKCPLGFFYEQVLRAPSLQSEAATYGNAAHNALQRLSERMKQSKQKEFPALDDFLSFFEREMENQRGYFSSKEYTRRLEMGRRNLAAFYQQKVAHWHKNIRVEYNLRNVELDGIPINGMIDKLELLQDNQARIIDYKTGSQDPNKVKPPGKSTPYGGNYWRQLIFYKLLYENAEAVPRRVISGTIAYLEPDDKGNFMEVTINYPAEQVQLIRELIREVYDRIMAHDFYEGCGESNCSWCRFLKDNQAVDSFTEVEVEELDD
ncbi:MAG: DNA-dependent ATPase [Saprospiraceae bacterium]|nr:MAG: DNA-dependent ATPase [Saprospiraceae bacterium]